MTTPTQNDDPLNAALAAIPPATIETPAGAAPETKPAAPPAPKRPTLFDLEAEYLSILVTLDEGGEIPDEQLAVLAQKLEQVQDALEHRVEGWARWIRQLEADADVAKGEAKRLSARGTSYERFADRLRDKLKEVLIAVQKERVKTPLFTIAVKATAASVASVSIPDLPTRYLKPPAPPEVDRKAILDEWKRTKTAPPGVVIDTNRRHLEIR